MRIPINLASEPFRRDRPMVVASTVLSLLLAGTLLMFISLAISERNRSAQARATVEKLNADLASLSAEQSKLEASLRQPQNAEVLDRVQFVNLLIQRKAVAWTRLFGDLEKVMPHNVRLVSVRPQINTRNEVILDMTVAAQGSEPVLQLLMALEASPQFGSTTVHNWLPPSQTEPMFRYRVSVQYGQKL